MNGFRKRLLKAATVMAIVIAACSIFCGCKTSKNKEQQEAYRQYGINCMKNGDYEEAIKAFQNALDQSIGGVGDVEIDVCLYKAKAQYLSGDIQAAEATYTALIDYKEYTEGYFQRANLYFAIGEKEKGLADLKKAVEKAENNYDIYIGAYELLKKNNYGDNPEEYLKTALAIKGSEGIDFLKKGRIYMLIEDNEQAIENLTKAAEKGEAQANFYLAQVYASTGEEKLSEACFEEYTKSGVASGNDLCAMSEALMAGGDFNTARQYLEAAQDMNDASDLKAIRKNLIICCENLGDFTTAKTLIQAYVKDYPDDEDAAKEKVFLETR